MKNDDDTVDVEVVDESNLPEAPKPKAKAPWRWQPGQSGNVNGRPKGALGRYTKRMVEDFAKHWHKHGAEAIAKVYRKDPGLYLKIATSLIPRALLLEVSARPFAEMSDAELQAAADQERENAMLLIEHVRAHGGEELIQKAAQDVLGTGEEEDEGTA
jgi:hypothetical protein